MSEGFNITCANCGCKDNYTVHGVTGYGVKIVCNECENEENIFW